MSDPTDPSSPGPERSAGPGGEGSHPGSVPRIASVGSGELPPGDGGWFDRYPFRPRTRTGPVSAVALTVIIMLISVIVGVAAIAAKLAALGELGRFATLKDPDGWDVADLVALLIVPQLVTVGLVAWFAGFNGSERRLALSLEPPVNGVRDYLLAIALMVVLGLGIGVGIDQLFPHDSTEDVKFFLPMMQGGLLPFTLFALVVGAPLSEELLFRGYLFPSIAKSPIGVVGATLISDLLWTALHAGNSYSAQGMLQIFLLGLVLSYILVRTGSIWPGIVGHGAYNGVMALFMLSMLPQTA
ncbi:MAG: CPBP family intramembrane glutamic endopeptidase [Hyphomicrobiaceae bacterium]